jgi:predicted amidohydrolase YtcJ
MSAQRDRSNASTAGLTRRRVIQTTAGMLAGGALIGLPRRAPGQVGATADLILHNGQITTLDPTRPSATAVAIEDGLFATVGDDQQVMALRGPETEVIDLKGRTVIPGLNDSHTHVIRGGLQYNMELRWEGVPSLVEALQMLKEQAQRTPPPQWVRVVGGWSEFQFAERRMPTLEEINAAAPDTPVFLLHLYARALLNAAALRAVGYTKETPDPPGGVIQRDKQGNPTGLLVAKPSALILYSTLAKGPVLSVEDQINSSRHFQRELNRLGITSAIDAGGGGQNYPDDYAVIEELHKRGQMTVRIAYNLFAQKPGSELQDYQRWVTMTEPGDGDAMLRMNGGGENLTWAAADFENFLEPRPELKSTMESELERIARLLVENRWPFRIHATYDESVSRFLDTFERVNRDVPFDGLRWIIDHAETVTPRNIERIKALGGGIAVQHRMAFQGEYFVDRYGAQAAEDTPPITRMLEMSVPVGAGTDATRVASFNPWMALYWLTTGKTIGGLALQPAGRRLDRATALRLWTKGSAWFSGEEGAKGAIAPGEYADLAALSADYFSVPEDEIKDITAVLTLVGGQVVHGEGDYRDLAPPLPPASPGWSPVAHYGGYQHAQLDRGEIQTAQACAVHGHGHAHACRWPVVAEEAGAFWGTLGCSCFAF